MRKVLIVDDSRAIQRQLEKIVEQTSGYQVVGRAGDGAEAIKLYRELQPELVLMDIIMPTMDGLQSLRTLLALDSTARVIMISSVGGVGHKAEEAIRLGARSVISKPFDRERVQQALQQAFEPE